MISCIVGIEVLPGISCIPIRVTSGPALIAESYSEIGPPDVYLCIAARVQADRIMQIAAGIASAPSNTVDIKLQNRVLQVLAEERAGNSLAFNPNCGLSQSVDSKAVPRIVHSKSALGSNGKESVWYPEGLKQLLLTLQSRNKLVITSSQQTIHVDAAAHSIQVRM